MEMIPDIRFEADVLRAALLLGLVREREVIAWADALLPTGAQRIDELADVSVTRPELTAVREALRPLAEPSDLASVGMALLTFLAADASAAALAFPDRVRILAQLRREEFVGAPLTAMVKSFEDRWMLALAGVNADASLGAELDEWLATVRRSGYYRLSVEHADERAALLGALSRKVVRDRRVHADPSRACCAWLVRGASGGSPTLMLNAPLWRIATDEFSPLPLGSRIPYPAIPESAVRVLDEASAEPMGVEEATALLATV